MKRGQIAIWVILGVFLLAAIILLLFFRGEIKIDITNRARAPIDVESYIETCTRRAVVKTVDQMLPQGGFVNPRNSVRYDGHDVEYICESIQYYDVCIQQHPMLLKEMESEIKNNIEEDLGDCFDEMESDFKDKGWTLSYGSPLEYNVELDHGKVIVNINREGTLTKDNDAESFEEIKVVIPNPAYDLGKVALEIAAQVGHPDMCYFEHVGYTITYPRYDINLYNNMDDSTKIYIIKDKMFNKTMNIAVRSCAIPKGI